jgi:hypothetical protein
MIRGCAGAALFLTLSSAVACAQQEPWGGNVAGWRFTQAAEASDVINCRAIQGPNLISRSSNGRIYVSVPPPAGLPRGKYREGRASIVIDGSADPVDAEIGGRLVFYVDDSQVQALARSRGYQWRVSGPKGVVTGSVALSGDVAKAAAELRSCLRANTAAAPPRQPAAPAASGNAKWSGNWVWIRPLTIFGKPTDTKALSIELLQNSRVNLCANLAQRNSCKVVPFSSRNGAYFLSYGGADLYEIRLSNDVLSGQFWFKKENRATTGPDATFVLRR